MAPKDGDGTALGKAAFGSADTSFPLGKAGKCKASTGVITQMEQGTNHDRPTVVTPS